MSEVPLYPPHEAIRASLPSQPHSGKSIFLSFAGNIFLPVILNHLCSKIRCQEMKEKYLSPD